MYSAGVIKLFFFPASSCLLLLLQNGSRHSPVVSPQWRSPGRTEATGPRPAAVWAAGARRGLRVDRAACRPSVSVPAADAARRRAAEDGGCVVTTGADAGSEK